MKECPQCLRCYPDSSSLCNEDGKSLIASLPGEPLLGGRYQLEQRLGQGSVGIVFKARHLFLKTTHAIKVITPELAGNDPALAERFRQEVTTAAAVSHRNLATVTDFGLTENANPFLVMEFIDGPTLASLLSQEPRMSLSRALSLLAPIAAGVAAIHEQGLVHGNLKPANIMTREHSSIASLKVVDLGLANLRRKDWATAAVQQQAAFLNSALYRAPELWVEDKPDKRSDVYSLAAIFYQMLTGVVPFPGDSIDEVRRKATTQQLPSFDSLGLAMSSQLEGAVFAALTKDRDNRIPTVAQFMEEIRRAIPLDGAPKMTAVNYSENFTMDESRYSSPVRKAEGYRGENSPFDYTPRYDAEKERERISIEELRRQVENDRPNVASLRRAQPPEPASNSEAVPPPSGNEPVQEPQLVTRPAPIIDENVQFTVFRPRAVEPELPYSILVYAHLAERAPDAPANSPDPREVVAAKAEEALGPAFPGYTETVEDAQQAIPRNGLLTFVPDFPGITLAPPQHMLVWRGPVHELEFLFTAGRELEGRTIRGSLRVYLGAILLAELNIAINVNTAKARQYANDRDEPGPMPTYRKIFASYSHRDTAIVEQFEQLVDAFGDKYLRDVRDIRAGEKWNDRLQELIRDADIFQLFWSKNSMKSEFVKDEWNYALSLNKPNFIRPTFWEEPMPEDKQAGLPPAALLELQFKKVPIYSAPVAPGSVDRSIAVPASPQTTGSEIPAPTMPSAAPTMRSIPPPPPISAREDWKSTPQQSAGGSLPYQSEAPPTRARPDVIVGQRRPDAFPERGSFSYREYSRKETSPVMFWLMVLIAGLVVAFAIGVLVWYLLLR